MCAVSGEVGGTKVIMKKHSEVREVTGLAKAWFDHPFGLMMQFLAAAVGQENGTRKPKHRR
jgi:hypothetical protein